MIRPLIWSGDGLAVWLGVEVGGGTTVFAAYVGLFLQSGGWVGAARQHCRVAAQQQYCPAWSPLSPVRWLVQWLIVGMETHFPFQYFLFNSLKSDFKPSVIS